MRSVCISLFRLPICLCASDFFVFHSCVFQSSYPDSELSVCVWLFSVPRCLRASDSSLIPPVCLHHTIVYSELSLRLTLMCSPLVCSNRHIWIPGVVINICSVELCSNRHIQIPSCLCASTLQCPELSACLWINKSSVNPKSTSNQSSKPCTVLQHPSRAVSRVVCVSLTLVLSHLSMCVAL